MEKTHQAKRVVSACVAEFLDENNPHQNIRLIAKCIGELQKLKNKENSRLFPNHGRPWTGADDEKLLEVYKENDDDEYLPAKLCNILGRTERSIDFQLSKLLIARCSQYTDTHVAIYFQKSVEDIQRRKDTLHK